MTEAEKKCALIDLITEARDKGDGELLKELIERYERKDFDIVKEEKKIFSDSDNGCFFDTNSNLNVIVN